MSDVAQKARFNIERNVPRFREWEDKQMFTKDEIRSIVQTMNDFEYKVLAPGSKASDYRAFADWEKSLETLRRKRCQRQKIKSLTSQHKGTVRIMNIYKRGVYRHPGSAELWRDYLDYAAKIKATRRWRKIMTQALRMRPTDPQLWVLAGRQSVRHKDMHAARVFFMRGCRFCSGEATVWLEYARCEMQWLRRVERKNNIEAKAGAPAPRAPAIAAEQVDEDDAIMFGGEGDDGDEDDDDDEPVLIPEPPAAHDEVFTREEDEKLAQKNPALDGAIPRAIFDIAKKQPFFNADAAEQFFDMFGEFMDVSAGPQLAHHVLDCMEELFPTHPATLSCHIRQPVLGLDVHVVAFPRGLREVLVRIEPAVNKTSDQVELQRRLIVWIDSLLEVSGLDEDLRTVLERYKEALQD